MAEDKGSEVTIGIDMPAAQLEPGCATCAVRSSSMRPWPWPEQALIIAPQWRLGLVGGAALVAARRGARGKLAAYTNLPRVIWRYDRL